MKGVAWSRSAATHAHLSAANLSDSYLLGANLSAANLSDAHLSAATLNNANLSDANLTDAKGWTMEQLRAARFLEGATMPDGQTLKNDANPDRPTFEEWLKGKRSGEDG